MFPVFAAVLTTQSRTAVLGTFSATYVTIATACSVIRLAQFWHTQQPYSESDCSRFIYFSDLI